MRSREFIIESHNSPFDLEYDYNFAPAELHANAYDRQGRPIEIHFVPYDIRAGIVDVEFTRDNSYDMTGGGDAGQVFATVLAAFREYLKGYQPKILIFSGKGSSRQSYYNRMIARYAAPLGYQQFDVNKLSPKTKQRLELSLGGSNLFVLRRRSIPVTEAKEIVQGFHVYRAQVRVRNPEYSTSVDTAVFAKSPAMARLLLKAQYGQDALVSNVTRVA